MILPTKHIPPERSLIYVSSEVLSLINGKPSVSSLWNAMCKKHKEELRFGDVPFDWFILSLDLLYLMGVIEEKNGLIARVKKENA